MRTSTSAGAALQDYIDKMIAEAIKRLPPSLSPEEQREKN